MALNGRKSNPCIFFNAVLSIYTHLYSKNKAKLQENPESYLVGYFGNGINAAILKLFCVYIEYTKEDIGVVGSQSCHCGEREIQTKKSPKGLELEVPAMDS